MLPYIVGRPVTMERYHRGIGEKGVFQKDVTKGFPNWLERVEVPKKGGTVHHPLAGNVESLLWLANQNTVRDRTLGRSAARPRDGHVAQPCPRKDRGVRDTFETGI